MPTLAPVSTLADLVRDRTDLRAADLAWLQRLVGEWQLMSDLSFADLVLHVRTTDATWLTVAHMRPTTGPTQAKVSTESTNVGFARSMDGATSELSAVTPLNSPPTSVARRRGSAARPSTSSTMARPSTPRWSGR